MIQTDTPMKLLTTIAAVLISISAFSQDYVEYNEGTFSRNGEELSMEQIYDITLRYKVGDRNLRRGTGFSNMYNNVIDRLVNNSLNGLGGIVSGGLGGPLVWISALAATDGEDYGGEALTILTLGTSLCVMSYLAFEQVTSKEGCLRKRDKEFKKVAEKINQAITGKAPSNQPSNTYIHESFK